MNKRALLAGGYVLGGITGFAAAALFVWRVIDIGILTGVFALAGIYIGVEDSLEGAIPADMVPAEARGTAYGAMGAVNGVGDLIASALVGALWTMVSPAIAFASAGVLMLAGAALTAAQANEP